MINSHSQPGRNRLAKEKSPYLLQHADNPVDWYPWGEEAFAKARAEDKPVLVSIGYSSCHWCHVMEHESFEDPNIAGLMNERFVCIKVDREERPDVDEIYMSSVQLMGIAGGWPLNVFVTPEGRPFFGGTYFPPEDRYGRPGWPEILEAVSSYWQEQRASADGQATRLATALTSWLTSCRPVELLFTGMPRHSRDIATPSYSGSTTSGPMSWAAVGRTNRTSTIWKLET